MCGLSFSARPNAPWKNLWRILSRWAIFLKNTIWRDSSSFWKTLTRFAHRVACPICNSAHRETQDIASYLLQNSSEPEGRLDVDPALVQTRQIAFLGTQLCGLSHRFRQTEITTLPVQLTLDKLRLDQGCLSGHSGGWPNFYLDESQQERLFGPPYEIILSQLNDEQRIEFHSSHSIALPATNGIIWAASIRFEIRISKPPTSIWATRDGFRQRSPAWEPN